MAKPIMPKSTGTMMTASCRDMEPDQGVRRGRERPPPVLVAAPLLCGAGFSACGPAFQRIQPAGRPACRQDCLPHRLLLGYLLATGSYKLRLVGGAGAVVVVPLLLDGLPFLSATAGRKAVGMSGSLAFSSGLSGRTKCGVITTSSSSSDFWVLRLRNSFPRIGMSPKPGTLFMTSVTWLLMRPADRKRTRLN